MTRYGAVAGGGEIIVDEAEYEALVEQLRSANVDAIANETEANSLRSKNDVLMQLVTSQERDLQRYQTALEEIMSEYVPSSNKPSNATTLWRIAANAINPLPEPSQ